MAEMKWTNFPYDHIPETLCIKRVRILQLSGDKLTWLWERHPLEAPTKLRQLSLSNCKNLQSLPEFRGSFLHLSSIKLVDCTSLKTIPESFGELQGLKHLQLKNCKALVQLPEGFGKLEGLKELQLQNCKALVWLLEGFGDLKSLCYLNINSLKRLKSLPESFGKLSQLKELNLKSCKALQGVPDSFRNLAQLECLRLSPCPISKPSGSANLLYGPVIYNSSGCIEGLAESFGYLTNLVHLEIRDCKGMEGLPESFGHLPCLRSLGIRCCHDLRRLPESFGHLPQLPSLWIIDCSALQGLPESFVHLPKLQYLELYNCRGLHGLPESSGHLSELQYMKFQDCNGEATQHQHLKSLVHEVTQRTTLMKQKRDSVANLLSVNSENTPPQLSDIEVTAHHFIQRHQSTLHPQYQMEGLCLGSLWAIPELFDNIAGLSSLTKLSLDSCLNLKVLPTHIDDLSHLTELSLRRLWNLEELPDTIGNLQNLQRLSISDCIVLKGFLSQLGTLCWLQHLTVIDCWMLEVLHLQALVSLEKLEVIGCVNMRSIAGIWGLPTLRDIRIEGCLNLRDILVVADINECASMRSLRNLNISGCYQLRLLMHLVVVHLPKLMTLQLTLNDDFLSESLENDTKTLPPFHLCGERMLSRDMAVLNAKTSPALFWVVEQKARNLLNTIDEGPFCFHKLSPVHDGSSSCLFSNDYCIGHDDDIIKTKTTTVMICFVSTICTVDFPMHIPPPKTIFRLQSGYIPLNNRFDFGEEIHMGTFLTSEAVLPFIEVGKQIDSYPSYDASIKDGWMILLRGRAEEQHKKNKLLAAEIQNIFYLELIKQRLLSRAWTRLPSQLCIFKFSALDIAGCQITKTSRHCNTCIMEEETGLTFKRRRGLFADDHALLLLQHQRRHYFPAYPGLHLNLEAGLLANLYEMSIYMLVKGNVVDSRKLQEVVQINQEEIPPIRIRCFRQEPFL